MKLYQKFCCLACCAQVAREGIKKASDQIHSSYAAQGVAGKLLLTKPTVDNPRNVLDALLYMMMFEVREGGSLYWHALTVSVGVVILCHS